MKKEIKEKNWQNSEFSDLIRIKKEKRDYIKTIKGKKSQAGKLDEIIIFSGDSDFKYLVKKLKDAGVKTIIYSSRKTISWELKLESSKIVYVEDIKDKILRQ